jgi:hypothetical protein
MKARDSQVARAFIFEFFSPLKSAAIDETFLPR